MCSLSAVSEPKADTTHYRALIQLLRTAEDLWNASRTFFSRWDLSPSQFNVLNVLHGQFDGLSQSELSRLLIMHRSNATGLVDRLERRGLVQRLPHPGDRRAYRVILTPPGLDLLNAIYPHYYSAAKRVWAGLPEPRVEQLLAELQNLAANAGAVALLASTPVAKALPAPRNPVPPPAFSEPRGTQEELRTSDL